MVNGKEFPYTAKGMSAAAKARKELAKNKAKKMSPSAAAERGRTAMREKKAGYMTVADVKRAKKAGKYKDWTEYKG
jgi:hypothetical protein